MGNPIKIIRACTVPASIAFVKCMIPDLVKKYEVILLSSPGGDWREIDDVEHLVKCEKIKMSRRIDIRGDIKSLIALWRFFRKERPQMVHSMTPKAGLLCMVASKLAGVPVRVHTFTGLVFPTSTGIKKRILMATDWITCAFSTHIIPEGEGVKRDLLNNRITNKDIHVLGYGNCQGINLLHFNPAMSYDVEKKEQPSPLPKLFEVEKPEDFVNNQNLKPISKSDFVTFIAVGRLVGDKGINELVAAFKKVNSELPKTRLILLGHTESKIDPLKQETIETIYSHPNIEAVGLQYDVRPWMSVADCAVLASYREGFPNAVIEAGAMGLPQIVTDINGANEIIVEGENGTIIPPRDSEALYCAMKRMALDSAWRLQLASKARPMVASRYDQDYVRKCLYEFYDKILGNESNK